MKIFALVAIAVLTANFANAATNIKLSCKVEMEGERTDDISNPSVSFDADKGYKDLDIDVYGSKVNVTVSTYMSADGKTCGEEVNQICVRLRGSAFCTGQPEAVIYPTDRYAQPGDRTTISCSVSGDIKRPCSN